MYNFLFREWVPNYRCICFCSLVYIVSSRCRFILFASSYNLFSAHMSWKIFYLIKNVYRKYPNIVKWGLIWCYSNLMQILVLEFKILIFKLTFLWDDVINFIFLKCICTGSLKHSLLLLVSIQRKKIGFRSSWSYANSTRLASDDNIFKSLISWLVVLSTEMRNNCIQKQFSLASAILKICIIIIYHKSRVRGLTANWYTSM